MNNTRLGSVYLSTAGTPVGTFDFIVDPRTGTGVRIDTPVAADTDEGVVIGVVIDMKVIGSDRDPVAVHYVEHADELPPYAESPKDAMLATVQVFHQPALRPVRAGVVRAATPEEMLLATNAERIEWKVPAGVVELADGQMAKIVLDGHTLAGPEAAHMMIAGRSGAAAKTSYAGVLLRSLIEAGDPQVERVAALVFNVKGDDLVNLDQPPAAGYELTADDLAIYEALGVQASPFDNVTVYAPSLPGGAGTRSSNPNAVPLRWGLREIWRYLRYFAPSLFDTDNSATLLGDLGAHHVYGEGRLNTLDQLVNFLSTEVAEAEEGQQTTIWRNHHIATARRVLKFLEGLADRCGGLVTTGASRPGDDVPVDSWSHGQVIVVDIAGLDPLVQSAVVARTCERILKQAEGDGLGVNHLVVIADELNMFAPHSGGELSAVRTVLQKIAATGRYAGISLWGAAQFLSQVNNQVRDNATTIAFGILAESEVDSGVYGRMPAGQRERAVTLPKGQMALRSTNLRGMLTIRFPRPAWCTGRPKGVVGAGGSRPRPKSVDTLGLSGKSIEKLTRGVEPERVEAVLARADGDVGAAVEELERLRDPDVRTVRVEAASSYDPDNPWDI